MENDREDMRVMSVIEEMIVMRGETRRDRRDERDTRETRERRESGDERDERVMFLVFDFMFLCF